MPESPTRRADVKPLAPERYKVQFTASAEFRGKLARLQALMPTNDLAAIIDRAVTEKLDRLESKRFGKAKKPRKSLADTGTSGSSRYLPAAVRRVVHERDRGRCTYVDERKRRCTARRHLEFHHVDPYGRGGGRDPSIKLMCRSHNALLAERDYGKAWMGQFRGRARAGQA